MMYDENNKDINLVCVALIDKSNATHCFKSRLNNMTNVARLHI